MARRFGRNQKRAMRNQIQSQEKLLEQHIEHISSLNHDLRQANEVINLTAEVLGEHFATLPVQTAEVKEIRERYEYPKRQTSRYSFGDMNPVISAVQYSLCYIDTYQADARIDELSGAMHMRYKSISGNVAYGVSEEAWRRLPEKLLVTKFVDEISLDMAVHLVRERKKALVNTYHLARN